MMTFVQRWKCFAQWRYLRKTNCYFDNAWRNSSSTTAVSLAPNEESYRLSLALDLMRHKSFELARVVLKQAEAAHPESWRVNTILGMLEYFAGSVELATRTLLRAADVSADPELPLRYL